MTEKTEQHDDQDHSTSDHEHITSETLETTRRNFLKLGAAGLAGLALFGGGSVGSALANTLNPPEPPTGLANADGRFAGKVVLITGATSGIGEATARAFAHEGASVHFCGRRSWLGRRVASSITDNKGVATYQRTDVREPEQVEAFVKDAVERYGRIDIAFNNAGIFMDPLELQDLALDNYHDMINTNLNGVYYAMRYQIPVMREQEGGIIVNMASVAGHRGFANTPHYNASKHGVVGLTKAAAVANAKHNIRINSVSPLAVDTPMLEESFEFQGVTYEQMAPLFVTPRIMSPYEIANAVMFLSMEEASYINGMDLDVTGGQLA